MSDTPEVAAARIAAERARASMMTTAHQLQDRLSPKTLARGAWQGAKEKGADLAEDAVDAVRTRPVAATGIVAAVTLFLVREALMDLASRLMNGAKARKPRRKSKQDKQKQSDTETVE